MSGAPMATSLSTSPGVLDVLRAARARISDPGAYTSDVLARTATGRPTMPERRDARSWCAEGALLAEAASSERAANYHREAHAALAQAANDQHGLCLTLVDAKCGHGGALRVYDLAIERVEASR